MIWNYALLDLPPKDEQVVLIAFESLYHLARYDAENHIYKTITEPSLIFNPLRQAIFWREISAPPDLSKMK